MKKALFPAIVVLCIGASSGYPQGITAVTRSTQMASTVAGMGMMGMGGGGMGGMGAGGMFPGVEAISPAPSAAAAMFGVGAGIRFGGATGMGPGMGMPAGGGMPGWTAQGGGVGVGGGRMLARRETDEVREERLAAMDERVLAFQMERARSGSALAQRELGQRYLEGRGVERSVTQARVWLEAASAQGDREAALSLRQMDDGTHSGNAEAGTEASRFTSRSPSPRNAAHREVTAPAETQSMEAEVARAQRIATIEVR